MNKDSLRPVLLELNVMLPVKESRVVAPCRVVTLDRRLCRTLQMDTVAKCLLEKGELSQKNVPWFRKKEASGAKTDTSPCLGKKTFDRRSPATSQQRARQKWFLDAKTL